MKFLKDIPYVQGYKAYEQHIALESNPFQKESKDYADWRAGWFDAQDDNE